MADSTARSVELVEKAKRVAQSVWLLEHARLCSPASSPRNKDDSAEADVEAAGYGTLSCETTTCRMKGCGEASRILAMVESGEKEESGVVEDAVKLLKHRAECPWALTTTAPPPVATCLICVLVARARPTVGARGICLDFSKRQEVGSFEAPQPAKEEVEEVRQGLPAQSSSTQELALLLSDMSSSKKHEDNNDDKICALVARSKPSVGARGICLDFAPPPPTTTTSSAAADTSNDDDVAASSSKNTDHKADSMLLVEKPPHKKRKLSSSTAPTSSRALAPWQQQQTPPAFSSPGSAAASSLLDLNKPTSFALVSN